MKKADLLFFDAGGGHRAAATALQQVIESERRPIEPRLVNLQEVLDSIDIFRRLFGIRLQDIYNLLLKKGWTLGSPQLKTAMQLVIRAFHSREVQVLEQLWIERRPDLVVSLCPNLNRAIGDSLRNAAPAVPLVTILTDIADYPPHFWIERQEQHLICGSEKAVEQAFALGHPRKRVHRVSGMILRPHFYETPPLAPAERAAARAELGFDPALPVGLVMFGGQGARVMYDIARRLPNRQLLLICGHNANLAHQLRAVERKAPIFVEGFTREIPRYMQLADYFIGKPGPGSISEAIAMHLPAIVVRNAWTLPQERYNAEWLREKGTGIVLSSFRRIAAAVDEMLDPAAFAFYRANAQRMENRAVFEIPEILESILEIREDLGVPPPT